MAHTLVRGDLEPLLLGGCFFGSGGGGTIESARGLVKHFEKGAYYPTDKVRVVSKDEATEGDAVMGAYTVAGRCLQMVGLARLYGPTIVLLDRVELTSSASSAATATGAASK